MLPSSTIIEITRDRFTQGDTLSSESKKPSYYFSAFIIDPNDPKKKTKLVDKATGVEHFEAVVKKAQGYDVHTLQILVYKAKATKDGQAEKIEINFKQANEAHEQQEKINEIGDKLTNKLGEIEDRLITDTNITDPTGLGLIRANFQHETEKLRWDSEKQIIEMKHEASSNKLNKELEEKEVQHAEDASYISELEDENKTLNQSYEELSNNRFTLKGVDMKQLVGDLGANMVTGFVKKNMSAVSQLSGLPVEALKSAFNSPQASNSNSESTVMEEENAVVEQIMHQLRGLIESFSEDEMKNFYELITIIATDRSNIEIILQLIKPNS